MRCAKTEVETFLASVVDKDPVWHLVELDVRTVRDGVSKFAHHLACVCVCVCLQMYVCVCVCVCVCVQGREERREGGVFNVKTYTHTNTNVRTCILACMQHTRLDTHKSIHNTHH